MVKIVCNSCKGTGVYKGILERDQSAVVCHACDGNGYTEAEEWTQRVIREDISHVFKPSGRIIYTYKNGDSWLLPYSVTYEEFLAGKRPIDIPRSLDKEGNSVNE